VTDSLVLARTAEAAGVEDHSVVVAHASRWSCESWRTDAVDPGLLAGAPGPPWHARDGELDADELAVVAVDHGGQVAPAALAAAAAGESMA